MAVKRPTMNSGASGLAYDTGLVLGVDNVSAEVRLNTGGLSVKVRIDMLPGKSAVPAAGETWLLDQQYGFWRFAIPLGYSGLDKQVQWTAATLLGSWANYSTPGNWTAGSGRFAPAGYSKDGMGEVQLRGTVTGGVITNTSAGVSPITADIFRLPVGMRVGPAGIRSFPVTSGGSFGAVLVMPDGYVRATAGAASTTISLDAVRFLAEQ